MRIVSDKLPQKFHSDNRQKSDTFFEGFPHERVPMVSVTKCAER